jgi:hypothetical protein
MSNPWERFLAVLESRLASRHRRSFWAPREYRRTCRSCGSVWHSLVRRERKLKSERSSAQCNACCNSCGTCFPSSIWTASGSHAGWRNVSNNADSELDRLRRCPSCMSSFYSQETI